MNSDVPRVCRRLCDYIPLLCNIFRDTTLQTGVDRRLMDERGYIRSLRNKGVPGYHVENDVHVHMRG